ncbi:unnamed protein product [Peronospora farinosa]|uniref:Micro-fibrillar-associated protein 1 C-terminal domain-containing protein n=1 Tax=Peronospora farinosa TaxID=134698 RepID=A0AAV0UE61_9STRA|nr:unnamed protein product [Peronospora farinosa]CAI5733735.1 unnamed protein product [Peronospora farinosa]
MKREFVFEAKATERRMSPEETAAKERDRLVQLEKLHVLRMHKADADDIENDDQESIRGRRKKVDEEPRMEMNNEEVDESKEEEIEA